VTCASSLPILVFLGLSVLDLGPMYATGRRQTSDAHHRLMPPPRGRGHLVMPLAPKLEAFEPSKIGTEVAHATRFEHHFQGQRSRSPGRFLTAALTREAGAAVTVRTYWAWETTATLRLLGGARGACAPTGEKRGGGISCRHVLSLLLLQISSRTPHGPQSS